MVPGTVWERHLQAAWDRLSSGRRPKRRLENHYRERWKDHLPSLRFKWKCFYPPVETGRRGIEFYGCKRQFAGWRFRLQLHTEQGILILRTKRHLTKKYTRGYTL